MTETSSPAPLVELHALSKAFDGKTIIADLDLTINHGEFLTILGPSGCGKTTVLRLIAGLEDADRGRIALDGQDITAIPAEHRHVNTVFQSYALFPHMSVFDNVAFGLRMQKVPAAELTPRVEEALRMVQLDDFAQRRPGQLSGGQQQRVAIARAVVNKPKVLLLDESLSALDYKLRKQMQNELKALQRKLGITFVFVTHDQEEAMEVADRIVVMSQGNIEQVGSPEEIMREPASRFVLEFMGEVNRLNGEIRGAQLFVGAHQWPLSFQPMHQGSVDLFLRPWEMEVAAESSERCPLPVQVLEVSPRGHFWQLTVQPIGWHQEPIGVVLPEGNPAPVRGGRYYVGGLNARLYAGDQLLQPVALAKSA